MPLARRMLLLGQWATPVPVRAKRLISAAAHVDAVGVPDVLAGPTQRLDVGHGPLAKGLQAELLLVQRLGQVGVQPHAAGSVRAPAIE
jgi:hypothetical protein